MRTHTGVLLGACIAIAAACSGGGAGSNGYNSPTGTGNNTTTTGNTIDANPSLAYIPANLTVSTGAIVTFTFESVQHTVNFATAAGAPANIPASSNTSVQRTFGTAGTFNFHCSIHPSMTGTVTVQ